MNINIYREGNLIKTASATQGETILARLSKEGIFLDAPCGGRGRCGKCRVRLSPDGEEVKACQTLIDGDTDVYVPGEMKMEIAGQENAAATTVTGGRFGVAIDIGTTTVVAHLTNLDTRERVATSSGVNAQRPYGADVISRIEYSATHGHETLTTLIQTQINGLVEDNLRKSGVSAGDVRYVSIAGNTIMQHLAAGFSPVGMGTVPFAPVSLFGGELEPWARLPASADCKIYYAPCISSYVGGDITAGMLACRLDGDKGPTVFIDIGTNGEIAMKLGDTYYTCATAAGPAFEGAEITCGMAAVPGAVSKVWWDGEDIGFKTIGDVTPQGLCGSGLLDALAVLLETGAVDETGRILNPGEIDHPIRSRIEPVDGKNAFWLSRETGVYMSAADVRKLQLAKSAIRSGIQTLMRTAGLESADIASFLLAGGFGSYLDQNSAARIGLFPHEFLRVTRTMGNTAGEGAALALCDPEARGALTAMRELCEYVELSTSPIFNEEFVENMMFE
jgi:uncharacterized 2Fe-2S/4Fe-4S cluster protein (DUF4445 family)